MPWFAHRDGRYGRSGHLERKKLVYSRLLCNLMISIWSTTGLAGTASNSGEIKPCVRAYSSSLMSSDIACTSSWSQHVVSTSLVYGYLLDVVCFWWNSQWDCSWCCCIKLLCIQLSASIRLQQLLAAASNCCVSSCIQLYELVLSQLHEIAVALSLAGSMPVELGLYIVVRTCKCLSVHTAEISPRHLHLGASLWYCKLGCW